MPARHRGADGLEIRHRGKPLSGLPYTGLTAVLSAWLCITMPDPQQWEIRDFCATASEFKQ